MNVITQWWHHVVMRQSDAGQWASRPSQKASENVLEENVPDAQKTDNSEESGATVSITEPPQHRPAIGLCEGTRKQGQIKAKASFTPTLCWFPPSGWGEQRQRRLKDLFIIGSVNYRVLSNLGCLDSSSEKFRRGIQAYVTQLFNVF